MNKPTHERTAERFPVEAPISGESGRGVTRNISATGVYFETNQAPALGQEVHLAIQLTLGGERTLCDCEGQVMRVEAKAGGRFGVAVRLRKNFFPMTDDFVDTAMRDTIPATLDSLPAALDTRPAGLDELMGRTPPGRKPPRDR